MVTKLDFSMVDKADIYSGDMSFSDLIPVWRADGSIVFVAYGRLLELFGGPGITTNTDTILAGGQLQQNDATTVLSGGSIGSTRPVNRILGRPL